MQVIVRWWDGYLELFSDVVKWRAGAYLLWIKMGRGKTRHIPLQQVRWFEPIPSDKQYLEGQSLRKEGAE